MHTCIPRTDHDLFVIYHFFWKKMQVVRQLLFNANNKGGLYRRLSAGTGAIASSDQKPVVHAFSFIPLPFLADMNLTATQMNAVISSFIDFSQRLLQQKEDEKLLLMCQKESDMRQLQQQKEDEKLELQQQKEGVIQQLKEDKQKLTNELRDKVELGPERRTEFDKRQFCRQAEIKVEILL